MPDPKLQMSLYYSWDTWGLRHNVHVIELFRQVYIFASLYWITLESQISHWLVPACFNAKWYRINKVSLFLRRLQRSCDFHCLRSGANVKLLGGCGGIFVERIFNNLDHKQVKTACWASLSFVLGKLWKWHSWTQHIMLHFFGVCVCVCVSKQIGKQTWSTTHLYFYLALSSTRIATTTRLFNLRPDQRDCQDMSRPSGGTV